MDYTNTKLVFSSNLLFIKPLTKEYIEFRNLQETKIYLIRIIDTKNIGFQPNIGIYLKLYYNNNLVTENNIIGPLEE